MKAVLCNECKKMLNEYDPVINFEGDSPTIKIETMGSNGESTAPGRSISLMQLDFCSLECTTQWIMKLKL